MTAPVPRLAPGVRLAFDGKRGQWLLQAPERVVVLDEIAHAVVSRIDGKLSLDAVIDALAADYDADRREIEGDVKDLVADLAARGVLR
ncbi:pyrroloquinoline quinone biosynthesis peptide chaperone PqqD [Zavarzinia sp.]|uniref:pyrroloquinoline quinone biosynthesis peptide chaperone PqqD n=1 Tax=Zavarzinia sp. TaxID=2027920 RepID=UPI00356AAD4F